MSHIDKLIADLCPNGIEFIKIEDLFDLKNGYTPSKSNSSFWENGTVPWFRMEDIRTNGRVLSQSLQQISESGVKGGKLFPPNSLLVATSATIGEHALITVPHLSNQRFTSLSVKNKWTDQVDLKFLYHYAFILDKWCRANTTTSSFASVDMTGFKNFPIPIPPLEVQREIVRVLDKFTQLEAELEAELEARRRQYDMARRTLLGKCKKFPILSLGKACAIKAGNLISKSVIEKSPGPYPVINSGREPLGFTSLYNTEDNPLGITSRGAGVGSVTWCLGRYFRGSLNYSVTIREPRILDTRFLFHTLNEYQKEIKSLCTFEGIPALNKKKLEKLEIPAPSLDIQKEVALTLDKLEVFVNDLSVGLPAELAARRKQYEYYRDRLLTFEEKR